MRVEAARIAAPVFRPRGERCAGRTWQPFGSLPRSLLPWRCAAARAKTRLANGHVRSRTGVAAAAASTQASAAARVDAARLVAADSEPGQWLSYGRTYDEQRFSPLAQIDKSNVARLGLAWFADIPLNRGQEATPLDGRRRAYYVAAVEQGDRLRRARPASSCGATIRKVPRESGVNACCDVVNRGVAAWNGKIYVGTLDGRLIALDAETGKPVWSVLTDRSRASATRSPARRGSSRARC